MDNGKAFALAAAKSEAFFARVAKGADNECWLWTGNKSTSGYGVFSVSKTKVLRAHRVAWSYHNNAPIPDGKLVCHSCDNPPCVNPAHLWIGSDADNNRDRSKKGRTRRGDRDESVVAHRKGVRHPASKFTEEQVLSIRSDPRSLSELAAIYGVNQASISKIKNRVTYAALIAKDAQQ